MDENDEMAVSEVAFGELAFTVPLASKVEVRILNCVTYFF
jgi:hypothetical protein